MKEYNLVVIGAGAGGLVIAIGAAKAGKKVLLIEKGTYGGDCTNFGCIPSKSLIASAHSAHALREGINLGVEFSSKSFDASGTLKRVRKIVEEVRSHEDPSALNALGVEVKTGLASFKAPHIVDVKGEEIYGKRFVIAGGSSPLIPSIQGLENCPYVTNETIFEWREIPESLAVLGGGPIGCELAQAFQRLGSKVTLIHSHSELLNKEEPLARKTLGQQLMREEISLFLNQHVQKIEYIRDCFHIFLDREQSVISQSLLVAVGRKPNVHFLNLDAAKVIYSEKGIPIDAYGRTNQKHIWAIGDITGPPFFTHKAENQARTVLSSLLLPFKKKLDRYQPIPRVTFTDPEIASVGLSEEEAGKRFRIAVYEVPFKHNDRAITTGRVEGFVRIITKKWSSQILGCTIVGPRAGEMLGEMLVAIHGKIPLRRLASIIHPYPTYNLALRKAADMWLTETILPTILLWRKKK